MNNSKIIIPDLALIRVTGANSETFLQGQLTCDLREINSTQSRLAAHCNAKGRVQFSMRALKFQDDFLLLLPSSMIELALQQLGRYAPLSRVILSAASELSVLGCCGQDMVTALTPFNDALPQQPDQASSANDILFIRVHDNQPRFLLIAQTALLTKLQQQLTMQYELASAEIWRLLDIQNNIANIYLETSDLFTPQMLNYPQLNAVSFNKGCYIGQEIIARTHYLGKVKRHLQYISLASEYAYKPGVELNLETPAVKGVVIDAIYTAPDQCQLLAVV